MAPRKSSHESVKHCIGFNQKSITMQLGGIYNLYLNTNFINYTFKETLKRKKAKLFRDVNGNNYLHCGSVKIIFIHEGTYENRKRIYYACKFLDYGPTETGYGKIDDGMYELVESAHSAIWVTDSEAMFLSKIFLEDGNMVF